MLEVEEKVTTFWHYIHPDEFDPYMGGTSQDGERPKNLDILTTSNKLTWLGMTIYGSVSSGRELALSYVTFSNSCYGCVDQM